MKFRYPAGATPLDPNEIEGLLLPLSTQEELNEFESEAILEAARWAKRSRKLRAEILSISGLKLLHGRMFKGVRIWVSLVNNCIYEN